MYAPGGFQKGTTRLSPESYARLVVRIVRNKHGGDVIERAQAILGERADRIGPIDLGRNVLRSWCTRVCRTYSRPPLVTGLSTELAAALGDQSASTTIKKYAAADGRPLPTTVQQASGEAQWFQEGAGYAGVRIGWSRRSGRVLLEVITPDDLELVYAGDDPTEPTIIRHKAVRELGGKLVEVVEVYNLTDMDRPVYQILEGGDPHKDITQRVHGQTFIGDAYRQQWSYPDSTPYHPIVVRGHPRHMYNRLQQVEASLVVPVRWTAWGSGCDFASHPGRNVRGLALAGMASSTADGATGLADGPDVVKQWINMDPDRDGSHWQDAPAFDPLLIGRAVGLYETMALSMIDLPLQMDATGGDPTDQERQAQEEAIVATFPESRRFDSELLRRCAALANRLPAVQGENIPDGPFGLLYRGEVDEVLDIEPPDKKSDGEGSGDDEKGSTTKDAPPPVEEPPPSLNGAQVTAWVAVLKSVADGTMTEKAAIITMVSAFPQVERGPIEQAVRSQLSAKVVTE